MSSNVSMWKDRGFPAVGAVLAVLVLAAPGCRRQADDPAGDSIPKPGRLAASTPNDAGAARPDEAAVQEARDHSPENPYDRLAKIAETKGILAAREGYRAEVERCRSALPQPKDWMTIRDARIGQLAVGGLVEWSAEWARVESRGAYRAGKVDDAWEKEAWRPMYSAAQDAVPHLAAVRRRCAELASTADAEDVEWAERLLNSVNRGMDNSMRNLVYELAVLARVADRKDLLAELLEEFGPLQISESKQCADADAVFRNWYDLKNLVGIYEPAPPPPPRPRLSGEQEARIRRMIEDFYAAGVARDRGRMQSFFAGPEDAEYFFTVLPEPDDGELLSCDLTDARMTFTVNEDGTVDVAIENFTVTELKDGKTVTSVGRDSMRVVLDGGQPKITRGEGTR